ncbi:MAG: hypothetical protein ACP5OX_00505 [Minisyncoccia bacterium]
MSIGKKAFVEIIPDITKIGEMVGVKFVLPTGEELIFEICRKLSNGVEILTVKKVNDFFLEDSVLFQKLKKKAIHLLITNPPDFSWLKCPFCNSIPDEIFDLLKARRVKEIAGRLVIKCPYCGRYYKIPPSPKDFLDYDIIF